MEDNAALPIQSDLMNVARELERRLERFVDGLSAAVFRGRMQPVDMANRLVRQADLDITDSPAGPRIHNRYRVRINPADLNADLDRNELAAELVNALAVTAAERGWCTRGPVRVEIEVDDSVSPGTLRCDGSTVPGQLPSWGQLIDVRGSRILELDDNRVVIGRSDEADLRLHEAEISRHHAVVFREGGRTWVSDAGSVNGTSINGSAVAAKPVAISAGDELTLGPATFFFRLL
jgi:hypothetical protein